MKSVHLKIAFTLATLIALFVAVVGVSAGKGNPPSGAGEAATTSFPSPSAVGGPDAFGYSYIDSGTLGGPSYNFEDISGTGTAVPLADDAISGAMPIGFNFNFYGATYSNVYISSNGFITFLAGQSAGVDGIIQPSALGANGIVAGYYADLDPSVGGTIYYQTVGFAPSRRFIVQYNNVRIFASPNTVTFQIKLFETHNAVEVHYATLANTPNPWPVAAGIEDQAGTVGLSYYFNGSGVAFSTPQAVRYYLSTTISLSSTSFNFGDVLVGATSATQTLTITNTGSNTLSFWGGNFISHPPFNYSLTCGGFLLPGNSCQYDFSFTTYALGPANGSLTMYSNAIGSPHVITLFGNGVSLPPSGTNLLLNPSFDSFGSAPRAWSYSVLNVPVSSLADCTVFLSANCSLKLTSSKSTSIVTQTVSFNGVGGEQFTYGLSSLANNVAAGGTYKVEVSLFNRFNRVLNTLSSNFNSGTHGWEVANGGSFTAPAAFTKIRYRIYFQKAYGTAWFDDAFLVQLP